MKRKEGLGCIATGDLFITRRLPREGYPGFEEIQTLIGKHEVRFSNLEMTFHNKEGYPAAVSGGTWAMTEPEALDDVQRFGFNLFNTANNHSCDYGTGGVLGTMAHLKERRMVFAGTGGNLAEASKACYLETGKARVALIGVSATFHESARAGGQSQELWGRPGLNPLRFSTRYHVDREHYEMARRLAELTRINASKEYSIQCGYSNPFPEGVLPFGEGGTFVLDEKNWVESIPDEKDMKRILEEIGEARRQADVVLVSVHSHEYDGDRRMAPAMFLEKFSRECIDAGAHVVLGHGPHELRGIEVYRGGVIFYSLGNFLFETETVSLQPDDACRNRGLPLDTPVGAYMDERSKNGTMGFCVQENIWRSVMAGWTMEEGHIKEVRLYPIELGMKMPRSRRGVPRLSRDEDTLQYLQSLSAGYGTRIRILDGTGYVDLE